MAISWNVDELRNTVAAQMAEANRLDEVIDELTVRAEQAEADNARLLAANAMLAADLGVAERERDAAQADVARLTTALALIDEARAKAVAEIEALHRYLDECFINAPDQGRAVPLVDRVVLLVSRWARAEGEADNWKELHDDRDRDLTFEYKRANAAEAVVARLREELAAWT